jgi:hypothetical protein
MYGLLVAGDVKAEWREDLDMRLADPDAWEADQREKHTQDVQDMVTMAGGEIG